MPFNRLPHAHFLLKAALAGACCAWLGACASISPRFSPAVAANFARSHMRKLQTPEADFYYPQEAEGAARQLATRMGQCLQRLRQHRTSDRPPPRALVFLTSANFNNAFVSGQQSGEPLHTLNPLFTTSELFNWFNQPGTNIGDIACHELTHVAHYEQVGGLWWFVNTVFGDTVPPQAFLERWFTEGLAQYYEGRLGRAVGRPHSPLYRTSFESGIASRSPPEVRRGDLSPEQRELLPFSGAYATSLPFIEYLASTYGEDKLWQLIDSQGSFVLPPVGVTLRFRIVFGADLGELVARFSEHKARTVAMRQRPANQTTVRADVGFFARLAAAPDGTLALVSQGLDEMATLRLLEPDGTVRASAYVNRITPAREWVQAGPLAMSGLSFTADSRSLFIFNENMSSEGEDVGQLWQVDARTGDVVHVWHDLRGGQGGTVHPSGKKYVFVRHSPGKSELVELDTQTGALAVLESGAAPYGAPAYSPDGQTLAYSRFVDEGFDLFLRHPDGTNERLTTDGLFNYAARFIDAEHLLFARSLDGRPQAHVLDLHERAAAAVTDAPYAVLDPAPGLNGTVYFLNRDSWGWSLDRAPASSLQAVALSNGQPAATAATVTPSPTAAPLTDSEPYSALERLFVPQLRMPTVGLYTTNQGGTTTLRQQYGVTLLGRDRLGFHTWLVDATLDVPITQNSQSLYYGNQQLAPWNLAIGLSRDQSGSTTQYGGSISASRNAWSARIATAVNALWRHTPTGDIRYIGPTVSLSYGAGDGTPYAGTQRALSLGASLSVWPRAFGSSRDVVDVQASGGVFIPLPVLKRHSFAIGAVVRSLALAPPGSLRVGGVGRANTVFEANAVDGPKGNGAVLPTSFVLGVRGYEDYWVYGDGAAVAEARYRYPFIVDRGTSSILWLLPSFFMRQVDLELFGAGAYVTGSNPTWLRAAGGQLAIRTTIGQMLPISLAYQLSVRFDQALSPLHTVSISFD